MNLSFNEIAPGFAHGMIALSRSPAARALNESVWIFSLIETFHLLFMAALGGAVLALNLRLLDAALTKLPVRDVERVTRPWLWIGTLGMIATGAVMALATAVSTLESSAFLVKMIALVAAMLLSVGVSRHVRRENAGRAGPRVIVGAAIALWLIALALFATTRNLGGGALVVAVAGFALLAAVMPRRRFEYLAVVVPVLGIGLVGSLFLPVSEEGDLLAQRFSFGAVALALGWALAVWLRERKDGAIAQHPARLAAFGSTLAWVTAAAAGRWIGFS